MCVCFMIYVYVGSRVTCLPAYTSRAFVFTFILNHNLGLRSTPRENTLNLVWERSWKKEGCRCSAVSQDVSVNLIIVPVLLCTGGGANP